MDYRLELALWVLLSVALYAGWWNFRHYVVERGRWRVGAWLQHQLGKPMAEVALECGAAIYHLGIPFAALVRGAALPRFMGLSNLDWVHGTASAIIVGLVFFVVLALLEVYALRTARRLGINVDEKGDFMRWGKEALLLQAHWAFYRALAVTWLGMHWGVLGGLLLPLAEWFLTPQGKRVAQDAHTAFNLMEAGGLAVSSAIIFLYSRNLLFTFLAHWLMGWGLGQVRARV